MPSVLLLSTESRITIGWLWKAAANISSLEKKPENGGMPAIAKQAMRNVMLVIFIYLCRLPISFISLECTACITEPAPRNRSALKKACVKR